MMDIDSAVIGGLITSTGVALGVLVLLMVMDAHMDDDQDGEA